MSLELHQSAVRTEKLSKRFGELRAVDQLDLQVERGTMYALVGPDGAGKTTSLRMMCGIIPATEGRAEVLGFDVQRNRRELKHRLGYLSQGFSLYEDLSIDENIEFFAEIHQVEDLARRRQELLEFTRLSRFHSRLAGQLSGGMKKKLALACTLVHRPEIIFLDEPTTGVDPVSRRDFWLILSEILKDGVSIVVSTPYLDEAERCSHVGLLPGGTLLAADTPEGMRSRMEGHIVEFTLSDVRVADELLASNPRTGSLEVQLFGDRLNIRTDDVESTLYEVSAILKRAGIEIFDAREISPSLENVYISMLQQAR